MAQLDRQDINWAIRRLPKNLRELMQEEEWRGRIFVGGGYLRSVVAGEKINDVDVFVSSKETAELLAYKLAYDKKDVYTTDNAHTVKGKLPIQIIHRWVFDDCESVSNSFDFTVCCAAFCFTPNEKWVSWIDDRFYTDLAAKRLVYRSPERNEDAGGSMLRVLKYYQKGYRIPLDSMGAVIARLISGIEKDGTDINDEKAVAKVITGLLIEVDPAIDPEHIAHLPSREEGVTS